jgi:hypothetical protein
MKNWISVKDKLPNHGDFVLVNVTGGIGVAQFSNSYGFECDSSAYEISAHDTSGLEVQFDGVVTHWMPLPTRP